MKSWVSAPPARWTQSGVKGFWSASTTVRTRLSVRSRAPSTYSRPRSSRAGRPSSRGRAYVQFTNVDRDAKIGILKPASTYGGALLASYAFKENSALAGRVEYEQQTGRPGSGTTSLLYGPGSSAASFTITPTFTIDRYFVRAEYSLVKVYDITRGDLNEGTTGTAFGRTGNRTTQERVMIEAGITF